MSSTTPGESGRGSLAARLTLWYSLFSCCLILAATSYLYWALAKNLDREDDGVLQDQVHILQVLLHEHPEDSAGIRQEVEVESGARKHSRIYIRILDEAGGLLAETPGMGQMLPKGLFPEPSELGTGRQLRQASESFRVMAAQASLGNRPGSRILQVALDRKEEDKLLSQFRRRILPLLAVSLVVCAVAGYQIARRGLRPIERISDAASRIRSTTLHERLAGGAFPAELGSLARTFNDMLDRLQESFDRLSRFSADIAHELR
ncbi:MAG TPA: HAMP domain-containing protein, partial [Planctomycetota bacterium]|nr:HAMP domain-containing protein [Planctomycetota bacterium]